MPALCTELNISVPEGMNSRIKVIKSVAYAQRDCGYFSLRVNPFFLVIHD